MRTMERPCEVCFLPFCQNRVIRGKSCSLSHSKLSTICWMSGCNNPRFQHSNGKKAPGCSRGHTFKINQILKGEKNCDGSLPSSCDKCRPYDARDVAHLNLITGDECYCYSCTCKK